MGSSQEKQPVKKQRGLSQKDKVPKQRKYLSLRTSPQTGVAIPRIFKVPKENSMTYYVYILTNANKNLIYIGVTNNLIRRVYEHKHHLDKGSYTARYNIDQLVYFEETSDVEAAISREKQLKGWNRARKNRLVESKNPEWKDIYTQIL